MRGTASGIHQQFDSGAPTLRLWNERSRSLGVRCCLPTERAAQGVLIGGASRFVTVLRSRSPDLGFWAGFLGRRGQPARRCPTLAPWHQTGSDNRGPRLQQAQISSMIQTTRRDRPVGSLFSLPPHRLRIGSVPGGSQSAIEFGSLQDAAAGRRPFLPFQVGDQPRATHHPPDERSANWTIPCHTLHHVGTFSELVSFFLGSIHSVADYRGTQGYRCCQVGPFPRDDWRNAPMQTGMMSCNSLPWWSQFSCITQQSPRGEALAAALFSSCLSTAHGSHCQASDCIARRTPRTRLSTR
jgi:hypothetical protein